MMDEIAAYIRHHGGSWSQAVRAFVGNLYRHDFIRKVIGIFASRIVLFGIGVLTSVIVARSLGPAGRGMYAVAMTIGAIGVQFGNVGLHASNSYYVARDRSLLPVLVSNALLASMLFGCLFAIATGIFLTIRYDYVSLPAPLLMLALAWMPIGLLFLLLQNLLLGIQRVRTYNVVDILNQLVTIVLVGLLLVFDVINPVTVVAAGFMGLIISCFAALWALKREATALPKPSLSVIKKNISYGLKAYLASFMAYLVVRVDLLMINYYLNAEQAGYYSISVAMADLVYMFTAAIGTILFPKLAAMTDKRERWNTARTTSRWLFLIMIVITLCAAAAAKPLVAALYGRAFLPAVLPFWILLPAILFYSLNAVLDHFLAASGFPLWTLAVWCTGLLLNIGMNILLIRPLGLSGSAFASLVAYLFIYTLHLAGIRRYELRGV